MHIAPNYNQHQTWVANVTHLEGKKQGVALTGRNTTGPLMQPLVSYVAYAIVTDDDSERH